MIVYGPQKNIATSALPQVPCALLCCAIGDVPKVGWQLSMGGLMLKHVERTHRGGTSLTPLSSWGALLTPREPATQAVRDGRDRPALILIPVMCCMLLWMLLGGQVGLGIVMSPLLRSASSLACLFLFSHVFTGHRALGRRAYLTLLGPAV